MFHESPVSLFSFQDIITSLTGIMIFFLLVFSINILEFTQKAIDGSPIYEELEQVKGNNKILKQQISDIAADIKTYRRRIQISQSKDESALMIERYRLEKKIRDLKFQKGDFEKKLKEEREKYSSFEKENRRLKQKQKEIEQEDKKLKNLASGIEEKKKLISEIRKAIAKRRKEVQITIDSSIDKIPILIDLSVEKICIVNTQRRTKRIFPRKSPIMPELVADAISYLRLFSSDKYYFVIMVKPSAAGYINFFLSNMRDEIKNASYGLEPIRENEGVTNE